MIRRKRGYRVRILISRIRSFLLCAVATLYPLWASAAQTFVYVAAPVCPHDPCASEVLVYDAATAGLVTRISLGAARPSHLALSPDGRRLYVSTETDQAGELIVIDTTQHRIVERYPGVAAGQVTAVSRDGSRLFIGSGSFISLYDTVARAFVWSTQGDGQITGLAASPIADRVYTTERGPAFGSLSASGIGEYETATGQRAASSPPRDGNNWVSVFLSRDGTRLYVASTNGRNTPSSGGSVSVFDPSSWASVGKFLNGGFPQGSVEAIARGRIYVWDINGVTVRLLRTEGVFDLVALVSVPSPIAMAISADESRGWIATRTSALIANSSNALNVLDLASNGIATTIPLSGAPSNIVATPPGASAAVCGYRVDATQSSWTVNGGTTSIAVKTPCTWAATSDAPWARLSSTSGSGDATLSLTVDQNFTTTNRSATLSIGGRLVHVTQASFSATPAFGFIDTPNDNTSGVTGALAVTGWALDDVGVTRVRVFRDPVAGEAQGAPIFIGDATFVEGARPDVQSFYPAFPNASRAGWGLQILTNMLPGAGDGTYRLLAFAEDTEGHTTLLGTRTITCANTSALRPFGTLDTPGQGQTVSGTIVNFGWALTPQPKMIPPDGSTIDVIIDGLVVGHPAYGFARGDIQALFPGFANTDGAVGYFILDTRTLTNGLHSIAWVVRDNMGATQGIGSRFFTVANP